MYFTTSANNLELEDLQNERILKLRWGRRYFYATSLREVAAKIVARKSNPGIVLTW
jgi:hypothetical protein